LERRLSQGSPIIGNIFHDFHNAASAVVSLPAGTHNIQLQYLTTSSCIINNAAANPYFGDMLGAEEWAWDKTFAVNLKGPFFMIQQAVPLMMASGSGAIVNVSSVNGVRPAALQGIYSITKTGLISMTQAYAKELASKKIRVNALLPGFTRTDFSRAIMDNQDIFNYVLQQIPMGREASPAEMVGAVLYLVSDLSSYTTGTSIICDGGMLA